MKIAIPMTAEAGSLKKLPKRGPMKIELDFFMNGLRPDGSIDISDKDDMDLYNILKKLGIGLKLLEFEGPGGGNPLVELHGTKKALTEYIRRYYLEGSNQEDIDEFLSFIEKA
jgi:hypothetical protein